MGDDDQRGAAFLIQAEQQIGDGGGISGVEISGGLIGKQDGGRGAKGPRQRYALLFATRQLSGKMCETVAETDPRQHGPRSLVSIGLAFQFEWQHDVFERRETADQMKGLEHETDMRTTQFGALIFVQSRERVAEHLDVAMGGSVEPGQQAEQGGFA